MATGIEMAKEVAAKLMAMGATQEQAERLTRRAFCRLSLVIAQTPEKFEAAEARINAYADAIEAV